MPQLGANRILAFLLGAFAVAYLIMAFRIPTFPIPRPIDSDLIPKVLGLLLLGLSIGLFLTPDDAKGETPIDRPRAPLQERPWIQVALTAVVIGLYALLLQPLGFVVASALLVGGLGALYGFRRHLVSLAVAVGVPLLLYLVLTRAMGVRLPRGILPF